MCAMIPMLRVLASWPVVSAMSLTPRAGSPCGWCRSAGAGGRPACRPTLRAAGPGSPAVVRECLVRLGHLVGVLTPLHRGAQTVARVEQLVHQTLGHRLLAAAAGVLDEPAQPERGAPRGANLDRHLVGRTTDAAA